MFRLAGQISRTSVRPVCAPFLARSWARTVVTTRYTKDHEFVSYDEDTKLGSIHITEYAQSSLGDVVFVELPPVGSQVSQAEQIGAVESVKAASDIYAPVSGEVTEINGDLDGQPGLLNKTDTSKNWLCKIKLSDPSELEDLLTEDAYKAHCETESGS